MPPFSSMFGDPFIEGTSFEGGHVVLSLIAVDSIVARLLSSPRGATLCPELGVAHTLIRSCNESAQSIVSAANASGAGGESAAGAEKVVAAIGGAIVDRLARLAPGTIALVAGGWNGRLSRATIVHVIERGIGETGSFVTCNSGPAGLEYHASRATAGDKVKHKTCARVDGIPWERVCDPGMWAVLTALWAKEPESEYRRPEVLYDVVLPWLVSPRTLGEALKAAESDDRAAWRTARRSETSAFASVVEALFYVLRHLGASWETVRRVSFALRREFLLEALDDLVREFAWPHGAEAAIAQAAALGEGVIKTDRPADAAEPPKPLMRREAWVLKTACNQLGLCAVKEHSKGRLTGDELLATKRLVDAGLALVSAVPVAADGSSARPLPPLLAAEAAAPALPFRGCGMLLETDVTRYVGDPYEPKRPAIADLLSVPPRAENLAQAVAAIVATDGVVEELMQRSRESSTAARLVLQYQAIEAIGSLFAEVLPMPLPLDCAAPEQCLWRGGTMTPDVQLVCLERVHRLALAYATLWQAIERPTRAFDSERFLVAGCMLCVFDAVVRLRTTGGLPLHISEAMWEDGGYAVSTGVCTNNRPFEQVSNGMELTSPSLTRARDGVLAYFASLPRVCRNVLFELRQPDKIELKKYGATMAFLRKLLERYHYALIPPDSAAPPSEMEALTMWLTSERTELASEHPEFGQLRDMVFLFKYLATMETREAELLRKRRPLRQIQHWRLTFEDDEGARHGFATWDSVAAPLRWEIFNFRGADLNTADVRVLAFGNKELYFGEGPVVRSPADLTLLAPEVGPMPTEDDILHATSLPTFGGTLSRDEAETLLSYLTVDYARVPLVVGFFASQDRATYLFDPRLRDLLRSVLFEPGPWVPESQRCPVEQIPVRRTALQQKQAVIDRFMDARLPEDVRVLATPRGLLLNELRFSPEATLAPLLSIVRRAVDDLQNSSVHSSDASFILALVLLLVDADGYILAALDERPPQRISSLLAQYHGMIRAFLQGLVSSILARWTTEAEGAGDITTACVVHGYRALLWSSLRPNELDAATVVSLFSSLAYVRNWHGFGMGQNRSDVLWDDVDAAAAAALGPDSRLLRFMQAQGIDTSRIGKDELDRFVKSPNKTLFLRVGNETIRCPRLAKVAAPAPGPATEKKPQEEASDGTEKIPPADVPEARLFALLQKHRRALVAWLEAAPQSAADDAMTSCIRTALRDPDFTYTGWQRAGHGRFYAEKAEITVDVQSAEIMWRNNELKPVPDSMTQFADFDALFGTEALHCGLVMRNEHRLWVHIVGTDYDLQEWDRPRAADQGNCAPVKAPDPPKPATPGAAPAMEQLCLKCGNIGKCWTCPVCTFVNCGVASRRDATCSMCGKEKDPARAAEQLQGPGGRGGRGGRRGVEYQEPPVEASRVVFEGVLYAREFDPYTEERHPQESEEWAVAALRPVIHALFPPMPPNARLPYPLLLPEAPLAADATEARLIGCEAPDKPDATWKEWVVSRASGIVHVYNLLSHGRRTWRSLVFTSRTAHALHSLAPLAVEHADGGVPAALLNAAGDVKRRRTSAGSLVISRRNVRLGGQEVYVPPRLLQGLIPSALLEAFRFWQGEDLILRGEPVEEKGAGATPWFAYRVEVTLLKPERAARITRKPLSQEFTRIRTDAPPPAPSSLLRHSASRLSLVREREAQDDMLLAQLLPLGYSREACALALRKTNYDAVNAASWLLDEANLPEVMLCEMTSQAAAGAQVAGARGNPHALVEEGFPPNSSQYALNLVGGDVDLARAWLLDDGNVAQILQLDPPGPAPDQAATSGPMEVVQPANPETPTSPKLSPHPEEAGGNLVLLNLIDAPVGSFLARLAAVLSRIEDLSHVLVWAAAPPLSSSAEQQAASAATAASQSCKVTIIELPRLKVKFQPQKDEEGALRLHLLDQAGWFISTDVGVDAATGQPPADGIAGLSFVTELVRGIPHAVVLQNAARELRVLVPNHDVYRPRVGGDPFSCELVCDRGSSPWQQVMDVRFFLYGVHTSRTFLLGQTLAARLYLLLLRLLGRQYAAAFAIAESCYVDTTFTADEKWIFDQLERTLSDRHPDAHACRLKASLAVAYSENRPPWELLPEADKYLQKLPRVSLACRLMPQEEVDVLHGCKSATARIKARLEYLTALQKQPEPPAEVVLAPERPRVGGHPWMKLTSMNGEYVDAHATHLTHMQYVRPGHALDGSKALELVWDDLVLQDELSGSNRQLGFLFLYDVLRGRVGLRLLGRDCTRSMGELIARWFHLKLARWGKETVDEGEIEAALPAEAMVLAALLARGDVPATWPAVPEDGSTARLLKEGVQVYGKEARGTSLKAFVDILGSELKRLLLSPQYAAAVAACRAGREIIARNPISVPAAVRVQPPSQRDLRPCASDTSCAARPLHARSFAAADLSGLAGMPLSVLGLDKFLTFEPSDESSTGKMPFSVDFHPASGTVVAQDMLRRISGDLTAYAAMTRAAMVPRLKLLSPREMAALVHDPTPGAVLPVIAMLDGLVAELQALQERDGRHVDATARRVVAAANHVDAGSDADAVQRATFLLRRAASLEATIDLDLMTSALLSTRAIDDLRRVNPYLVDAESLVDTVSGVLLHTSRVSQANRAISLALALKSHLRHLLVGSSTPLGTSASKASLRASAAVLSSDNAAVVLDRVGHAATALAETLACRRYYVRERKVAAAAAAAGDREYDPRYLVFEYTFDILLRERQVEMIEEFVGKCRAGQSHVQQMIMGYGKTTVVGPLLSLILADGQSLVVQVMPTALLEQTRNILRNCFSAVVKKRVFTLQFDRSVEDSAEAVAERYAKLSSARANRGVICAAPESVKSLALKFVEQLHAVEGFDFSLITPSGASARGTRDAVRLRDSMAARSDMADALVRVLEIWKSGILIMDEVDVLLHPLRSELNFPIGDKQAIDLAGHRWDMPIHLLDAVFFAERGSLSTPVDAELAEAERRTGVRADEVLRDLAKAINVGYTMHFMQRNPHLVLLDLNYYASVIRPLAARWLLLWLVRNFIGAVDVRTETLLDFLQGVDIEGHRDEVERGLLAESKKLLNLGADWIRNLLPHVLSKIDRVTYGLLSAADLAAADPRTPLSRLLMAVPFVGKDVPSRSSEFAHPDAVIGLTVLAYRYEGLRLNDLRRLVAQLKQDYSRQVGPRDQRPASVLFSRWLALASTPGDSAKAAAAASVLPLALFQPNDPKQLAQLFALVRKVPQVVHYFLCQHVFPACMNFQKLKISACGHELGSDILFGRRIGFSGTPSNLLPLDLGQCEYEPGSDGRILSVLTNPAVVTASIKENWSAKSLLRDLCAAEPPFHALIDTGALITGMENEEVAHFVLRYLPDWMEGVVYLDRADRQMILLRSGRSVLLTQCGVPPERRLTFYDQVHTTGMDIKQFASARAVLTLGKDMSFRDYAQGAFRMRGIGKGMCIHLYVIPEVQNRIEQELGSHLTGKAELDVPAWLLVNSMRMESLQFIKMSMQELANAWRKRALGTLVTEVQGSRAAGDGHALSRLRRFEDAEEAQQAWMRKCVGIFREVVSYAVEDHVPRPRQYSERLSGLIGANDAFVAGDDASRARITAVAGNLTQVIERHRGEGLAASIGGEADLNAEVVHEQEAQEEEEAEEEAEEEEQKMSAFTRDDEQHNPWPASLLAAVPSCKVVGEEAFYRFRDFHVRDEQPKLAFPERLLLSDNFFRPRWAGLGQRRLKNAAVVLEWVPLAARALLRSRVPPLFQQLTKGCGASAGTCAHALCRSNPTGEAAAKKLLADAPDASAAAAVVLKLALTTVGQADPGAHPSVFCPTSATAARAAAAAAEAAAPAERFVAALSLAEAETMRRLVHLKHGVLSQAAVALHTIDGRMIDASDNYWAEPAPGPPPAARLADQALLCLRFFNCEMYFTDPELTILEAALAKSALKDRIGFFGECLRLRQRDRHLWGDTPLARLFAPQAEWRLLPARAVVEQARVAVRRAVASRGVDPYDTFSRLDADHDGAITYEQVQRLFEWLRLGFSPGDCHEVARMADPQGSGVVTLAQLANVLQLDAPDTVAAQLHEAEVRRQIKQAFKGTTPGRWQCQVCSFMNGPADTTCAICECGWTGHRECPRDKWVCASDKGGCTFFNPKTNFYCEMCNRAKPDLANVRLI